jgi:hypothetical protein
MTFPHAGLTVFMNSAAFLSAIAPGHYGAYLISASQVEWCYARKDCYGARCDAYFLALGY